VDDSVAIYNATLFAFDGAVAVDVFNVQQNGK
jgi:hypothetical protein